MAFASVEGLPAGYRLEYDLTGKQIRLVKINVGITATSWRAAFTDMGLARGWCHLVHRPARHDLPADPIRLSPLTSPGPDYLDSAVVNGGTYYYTVQSNLGAYSDEASALFSIAVRNFTAIPGYNTVGLSWTPVDAGTVTYTIHRATSPAGLISSSPVASPPPVTPTTRRSMARLTITPCKPSPARFPVKSAPRRRGRPERAAAVGASGRGVHRSGRKRDLHERSIHFGRAGGGAASTADAFHFVYLPVVGNCTIICRVDNSAPRPTSRRAGVMIRQSLNANAIELPRYWGRLLFITRVAPRLAIYTSSSTSNTTPLALGASDPQRQHPDRRSFRKRNNLDVLHRAHGHHVGHGLCRPGRQFGQHDRAQYRSLQQCFHHRRPTVRPGRHRRRPVGPIGLDGSDRCGQLHHQAVHDTWRPLHHTGHCDRHQLCRYHRTKRNDLLLCCLGGSGAGESVNSSQVAATPGRVPANGIWANVSGGNWSASANWLGGLIAGDIDKSATFNLAGGGTINQDMAGLTIGGLVFAQVVIPSPATA